MFGNDAVTPITDQNAVCMDCHAKDVTLGWVGSMHERNDTGCASCHQVHSATDPVGLHALQADVCFECHKRQRSDSMKPSSHPIRSDNQARVAAMTCTSCHNPHASVASALLIRNTTNELCTDCHAEYRGPMLFDHAPVSEDCTLCHQPHGSQHANLLKRRPPLLCQSCHSQRGHPSLSYTDASLPGNSPSAMVLERSCLNCHTQVHGSNHPSGYKLTR
jgi:DmsE family decaheme c-type cytochrome